ncbi:DUF2079 domain-containing protein [Streptacidiphilus sp. EB129]|uniref:DUF2079 domain-containing protein n=1 Tax=Streptacidiphilus sp. EB129 TaxID=3156262 RepID=UPI0035170D3C
MKSRRTLPWLLAAVLSCVYSAVSIERQRRMFSTGFDLGIFDQAVRGYAGLGSPLSALKGAEFNLLGDHFSPVLALLAPAYRVFPHAETLLVAQALLLALSAVPVTRAAIAVVGTVGGTMLGAAYGLSFGLQYAAAFDFHEVAFAVPLVAMSVAALSRNEERAAVCWALPLLLVKEDQGLLLAAVGVYVWCRGRRPLGAGAVLLAVASTVLLTTVVIPAFNLDGTYAYSGMGAATGGDPLSRLLLPATKEHTVLLLLAPTLFLALRSPLVLLAVLPLAARFWVLSPAYWGIGYHYDAELMPILFLAMADGLRRAKHADRRAWTLRVVPGIPAAALAVALAATLWLPVGDLAAQLTAPAAPAAARGALDVSAARRVLALIPDGASVAAANRLAPQLTDRCTVSLFPYLTAPGAHGDWSRPTARWVALQDRPDPFPLGVQQQLAARARLPAQGYHQIATGGGVTLYAWTPNPAPTRHP